MNHVWVSMLCVCVYECECCIYLSLGLDIHYPCSVCCVCVSGCACVSTWVMNVWMSMLWARSMSSCQQSIGLLLILLRCKASLASHPFPYFQTDTLSGSMYDWLTNARCPQEGLSSKFDLIFNTHSFNST